MGTPDYRPFRLAFSSGGAVHLKPFVSALLHIPYVHFALQHPVHGGICPVICAFQFIIVAIMFAHQTLILAGAGYAFPVERFCNSYLARTLVEHIEYASHHRRRGRVDDEAVFVFRVLHIAVAGKSADEVPAVLLCAHGALHLFGYVPGILGVE